MTNWWYYRPGGIFFFIAGNWWVIGLEIKFKVKFSKMLLRFAEYFSASSGNLQDNNNNSNHIWNHLTKHK